MRKICFALAFTFFTSIVFSQAIINRDAEIASMVKEVNPDSLKSYMHSLVSFGTRNTLSTQTDLIRGIGAARNWVLQKFTEFSRQSNGRLTAFIDTTTLQPGKRVDMPTILGNVVAVLKGTDTETPSVDMDSLKCHFFRSFWIFWRSKK